MALRLIGESSEPAPAAERRLSDRAVLVWAVIWTVVSAAALIVFWVLAVPVREPIWTLVVFISCTASSMFMVAISKLDTLLVLSPAPVVLFLAAQSTNWAEAIAVWGTAYLIGCCLATRDWADTVETVSYLLGGGLVALAVLSWLHRLEAPWALSAVAFVTVYLVTRLAISVIRLLVITRLGLREVLGHILFRRMCAAWASIALLAVVGEGLRQMIGSLHPSIDLYWSGALVLLFTGIATSAAAVYLESKSVSNQLTGTLAAANGLPWSSDVDIKQHALDYAKLALPQYTIEVQSNLSRNVNEIVSSLGDGYLVARRGTAQRPFLVQDQLVLDAIAHMAVTMAATYRERESLARSATTDDLTGLPNYRGFRAFLAYTAETAHEGFAVVYIDVDHFKEVNDDHGHEVGNVVLRSIATRLRSRNAASDLVARIGGDEFVLVLTGIADEEEAERRASELLGQVSAPIVLGDTVIVLSFSWGIAFAHPGEADIAGLVEAADARMYANRGRQVFGDAVAVPELRGGQDVIDLVDTIQSAIQNHRLTVMYQPVVDAVEDRIVGFEALIRPNEQDLMRVPPDVIVHEAQRLGLLTELSIHVIETAVADLHRFQRLAPELENVSVNIDVEQVTDPVFLEAMSQASSGCNAGVALELSETSLNRSSADLHRELNRLRGESGVKIALDDFGRRSSTLLSLLQYPVDILKIDRALVEDMHLPKQQAVMGSMAALAQNLDVRMVVEGVEDEATREELLRAGVRFMQGYRFGAALSADDVLQRISEQGLRARPQ